ncbi:Protein PPP5D1 [Plecturocebus cupreus]
MGFHHVGQASLELLTSKTGTCHVAQACLKLLGSSNPPTSAFQSAGTASMSCHAQPSLSLKRLCNCKPFLFVDAFCAADIQVLWSFEWSYGGSQNDSKEAYLCLVFCQGRWTGRPHYLTANCQSGYGKLCTPKATKALALFPRLKSSGAIMAHYSLNFLGSSDPLASASQVAGTTGVCHHTWLIFKKMFNKDEILLCCPGWSQTHELKRSSLFCLPKCWDYKWCGA